MPQHHSTNPIIARESHYHLILNTNNIEGIYGKSNLGALYFDKRAFDMSLP